ncbi:hypothetical protein RIF29_08183 [Crotalaria pallida]|uniref:Uncharacterized protein n=1 Tax=Crotalaria pallida TaxID=3830 RepID=A0AAN9J7Y4_CROPI
MNQQNQGSGTPSTVPMKRKRGRPRKEGSVVQSENNPVMLGSDNVFNSNQTSGTSNDCDDEMVGKVVTGVIEGTFKAGYLLNVKVADTDAFLRGLVFLPGQVAPITAENDIAPHLKMIKRKEIPIPVLTPQTEIHGSVPSSVQCSKQPFQPELQLPLSNEQVLPTEINSGISVSLENQPASAIIPIDIPKNENSISTGGIPQGMHEPGHEGQSASIISELECDKAVERDETLRDINASTQVKDSNSDEGATETSLPASEPVNLFPTIDNTDLRTGQQAVPFVLTLNEQIRNEPNTSNIELNLIPVTAEPESMPSEHISKSIENFVEKQASPKTDVQEDTKTELAIETLSKVDTSNSNGRTSTDTANILDAAASNHALDTSQTQSIPFEPISKSSESKFSYEGCDFQEKNDSLRPEL